MTSKRRPNNQQKPIEKRSPVKPAKPVAGEVSGKTPGKRMILAICFVISFVLYGNTLSNGYSLDDELVTLNQKNVEQGFAGIPAIFGSHYSVNAKQNYEYRPVVITTYAIEYQLFGRNPAVSHFINIVLYALAAFMVYYTLKLLFPQQHWSLPALTMFIFLIHPLHSEVVASLKNRDEILALIFALLSMRVFVNFTDRKKPVLVLLGILFFVLAFFSKKSCMPYLFIIPFTVIYIRKVNPWKAIGVTLGVIALAIFFVMIFKGMVMTERGQVDRHTLFFENPLYEGKYGIGQRVLMALGTFGFYIKMVFVPYPLVAYYGYDTLDGFHFGFYHVLALLGAVGLLWIIFRFFKTNRPLVWGAVVFIAGISMFTNLLVPAVGIVAERFAFEASLGFSLMLAVGLLMVFKAFRSEVSAQVPPVKIPQNLKIAAVVLAVAAAIIIIPRNISWNNQISLYRADIQKVPRSAKLNSLLGSHYALKLQEIRRNPQAPNRMMYETYADSCIYFFRQALAVYPEYTSVNNNLGTVYINYRYNLDSGQYYFQRAIAGDPKHIEALSNYGAALEAKAELETEKISWVKGLPTSEGNAGETAKILKNLEANRQTFVLLGQMKNNLLQTFNTAMGGKAGGKPMQRMDNITTVYSKEIVGKSGPGVDPVQFKEALLTRYKLLRDRGQYDKAKQVTDSVVNVFFNPALCRTMEIDPQKGVPTEVKTALESKQQDYRLQAYRNYKKSLEIKPENSAVYSKLTPALIKWNMIDELIGVNNIMLKAKNARIQAIEFNTAKAYFLKNDFASAYIHTVKAIEAMKVLMERLRKCMVDFSAAGNQFSLSYFAQALKLNQETVNRYVTGFNLILRQHNMNAEAEKLEQLAVRL